MEDEQKGKPNLATLRIRANRAAEAALAEEAEHSRLLPEEPALPPPPMPEEIARRDERRRKDAERKRRQHERDKLHGKRVSLDVDSRTHDALNALAVEWDVPLKAVVRHLVEWAEENRDKLPRPDFALQRRAPPNVPQPQVRYRPRYLSFFAGIEAFSQAVHDLDWEPVAVAQWDPKESTQYAARVLLEKLPVTVRNLGDITRLRPQEMGGFEVLVGGSPCQAFSRAGQRAGMQDPRGRLTEIFIDFACRAGVTRSRAGIGGVPVLLWENVVGVLSHRYDQEPEVPKGRRRPGNDATYDDDHDLFGSVLSALAGFSGDTGLSRPRGREGKIRSWPTAGLLDGPSRMVAWRVLDAVNFGVPQSRRRLFVVAARRGDGIDPLRILFSERPHLGRSKPAPNGCRWWAITPDDKPFALRAPSPNRTLAEVLECANTPDEDDLTLITPPLAAQYLKRATAYEANEKKSPPLWLTACLELAAAGEPVFTLEQLRSRLAAMRKKVLTKQSKSEAGDQHAAAETVAASLKAIPPDAAILIDAHDSSGRLTVRNPSGHACTMVAIYGKGREKRPFVVRRRDGLIWLRRLTVTEGERLMGFPDGYTRVGATVPPPEAGPPRQPETAAYEDHAARSARIIEGLRFKVLGNSMAVPVMRWLAERIDKELRRAVAAGTFVPDREGTIPFLGLDDPEILTAQAVSMAFLFGNQKRKAHVSRGRLARLMASRPQVTTER